MSDQEKAPTCTDPECKVTKGLAQANEELVAMGEQPLPPHTHVLPRFKDLPRGEGER